MRVFFMGTPEFALISLERLCCSCHRVIGVLTAPDRPQGRGLKVLPSPVKRFALENGLPIFQPSSLPDPDLLDFLNQEKPDAIIVVACGLKIPRVLLELPRYGCINLHASLLPKYRGASPIQAALLNGEKVTGVTTMKLDEGWDTGDLLLSREIPISSRDNFGSLHDRLAVEGAGLLVETLDLLEKGKITPVPQKEELATYARKLKKDDLILDWTAPSAKLLNQIRAFDPWPGARTYLDGKLLKVWSAAPGRPRPDLTTALPGTTGEFRRDGCGLPVRTGDGVIELTELQLGGKKRLPVAKFLAGSPIPPGTVLG
ncbi:MAG: methionyl-tRNA formyltransferase [Firmicutes bacterium]|nr:methionyl-tRNA formyltransferase [Bacillota bacterium]